MLRQTCIRPWSSTKTGSDRHDYETEIASPECSHFVQQGVLRPLPELDQDIEAVVQLKFQTLSNGNYSRT